MAKKSISTEKASQVPPQAAQAQPAPAPQRPAAKEPSARPPKPAPSRKLTHTEVADRAKAIWRAKGCPSGQDEQNWYEAESQLKAEMGIV